MDFLVMPPTYLTPRSVNSSKAQATQNREIHVVRAAPPTSGAEGQHSVFSQSAFTQGLSIATATTAQAHSSKMSASQSTTTCSLPQATGVRVPTEDATMSSARPNDESTPYVPKESTQGCGWQAPAAAAAGGAAVVSHATPLSSSVMPQPDEDAPIDEKMDFLHQQLDSIGLERPVLNGLVLLGNGDNERLQGGLLPSIYLFTSLGVRFG